MLRLVNGSPCWIATDDAERSENNVIATNAILATITKLMISLGISVPLIRS
jgi:hypothetical protein